MHSMTKEQRQRAVFAVAWFTATVNFGFLGLKWAGVVEDGWLWDAVLIFANVALAVACRVLRPEFPKTPWQRTSFMAIALVNAYITLSVMRGRYELDALWTVLLPFDLLAAVAWWAFFTHRRASA